VSGGVLELPEAVPEAETEVMAFGLVAGAADVEHRAVVEGEAQRKEYRVVLDAGVQAYISREIPCIGVKTVAELEAVADEPVESAEAVEIPIEHESRVQPALAELIDGRIVLIAVIVDVSPIHIVVANGNFEHIIGKKPVLIRQFERGVAVAVVPETKRARLGANCKNNRAGKGQCQ